MNIKSTFLNPEDDLKKRQPKELLVFKQKIIWYLMILQNKLQIQWEITKKG